MGQFNTRYLLLGLVLVAALLFSLVKSRVSNYQIDRVENAVSELGHQFAVLDEEVVRARYQHLYNYDALVESQKNIQRLLADLLKLGSGMEADSDFRRTLVQLQNVFEHKSLLIERFKSYNSILQLARGYFIHTLTEIFERGTVGKVFC